VMTTTAPDNVRLTSTYPFGQTPDGLAYDDLVKARLAGRSCQHQVGRHRPADARGWYPATVALGTRRGAEYVDGTYTASLAAIASQEACHKPGL
jgi:hypothetical protein